jgi:hypothetical protein
MYNAVQRLAYLGVNLCSSYRCYQACHLEAGGSRRSRRYGRLRRQRVHFFAMALLVWFIAARGNGHPGAAHVFTHVVGPGEGAQAPEPATPE